MPSGDSWRWTRVLPHLMHDKPISQQDSRARRASGISKLKPRKTKMSKKYKYAAVKGTANSLFTRMAFDEVDTTTEFAQHILDFVHDKISEQDYAQLKKMLQ